MTTYTVLRAVFRIILILLNNLLSIPTYLLWMAILRPLLINHPDLYNKIESIGYSWLLHLVSAWTWTGRCTLAESGDDVSDLVGSRCLVISNHQSTADVPMLMYLCTHESKRTLARNIYWIMDVMFKYTNFGWVSSVHGDFYVRQGRDTREMQMNELRSHLRQVYIPRGRTWILLFPEGGFFHKRKEASQIYAKKHGYPALEHVTLPRIGAFQTILQTLLPTSSLTPMKNCVPEEANDCGDVDSVHLKKEQHLEWIIDITIAYTDGKPLGLVDIIFGNCEPRQTVIHLRRYRAEDVELSEGGLLKWIYTRWAEKDELLEHFYRTGKFPVSPAAEGINGKTKNDETRMLHLESRWYLLYNAVFTLSTCLHLYVLYNVASAIRGLFSYL